VCSCLDSETRHVSVAEKQALQANSASSGTRLPDAAIRVCGRARPQPDLADSEPFRAKRADKRRRKPERADKAAKALAEAGVLTSGGP
jgi:hypothetical protein